MTAVATIARHELKALLREQTFLLLLGLFLVMASFSVSIGWSTRTTTAAIYDATVGVLTAAHAPVIPPNPLLAISPLTVFDNMVVYLLLVGALLAIVIGHRSFMRERRAGIVPLLFVRPFSRAGYLTGKVAGIVSALVLLAGGTFALSLLSSLFIPALRLTGGEVARLAGFYGLSFVYLACFAMLGLWASIRFSSESMALFVPVMAWIAVVFVVPELATGQNPVSLLNPITLSQAFPDPTPFFAAMRTVLGPLSIGQFYATGALTFLKAGTYGSLSDAGAFLANTGAFLALGFFCVLGGVASWYELRRYAIAEDPLL